MPAPSTPASPKRRCCPVACHSVLLWGWERLQDWWPSGASQAWKQLKTSFHVATRLELLTRKDGL